MDPTSPLPSSFPPDYVPESASASFAVPMGLAAGGKLVAPARAIAGVAYRCPGCASPLVLKAGPKRVRHFAHTASTTCSGETALHAAAKALVAQAIEQAHAGAGEPIRLARACRYCTQPVVTALPRVALTGARLEAPIGAFRCDVAGLRGDTFVLAIEIRATHAVDEAKVAGLAALGMPFVELDALPLLAAPHDWTRPVRVHFHADAPTCKRCRSGLAAARWLLARVDIEQPMPPENLLARKHAGWSWYETDCVRCGTDTLVFTPVVDTNVETPGWQPALARRHAPLGRRPFWASHCHRCSAVTGPFNIVHAPQPGHRARVLIFTPNREQPLIEGARGSALKSVRRLWAAWDGAGAPPAIDTSMLPVLAGTPDQIVRADAIREAIRQRDPCNGKLRTEHDAAYWIRNHADAVPRQPGMWPPRSRC